VDEFTRIRTFIKVVQTGSFSAAARNVSSSVSSVARQIKTLEDALGARLLNRNTRSLSLTEAGRLFHARVRAIASDLDKAKSEVSSLQEDVKGMLRVLLRVTSGTTVVIPALPKFLAQYPELKLDISLSDTRCDLIANQIDVALWLGELPNADIVARRLSATRRFIYGSPAYFARHGAPAHPQDLCRHNCLLYEASPWQRRWMLTRDGVSEEVAVDGNIKSNNGMVIIHAALEGLGIGIAHEYLLRRYLETGQLARVMPQYTASPYPGDADLYAVFPHSRRLSRKVRVFVDFLIDIFSKAPEDASPDV